MDECAEEQARRRIEIKKNIDRWLNKIISR